MAKKVSRIAMVAFGSALAGCAIGSPDAQDEQAPAYLDKTVSALGRAQHVADELLVQYHRAAGISARSEALARVGGASMQTLLHENRRKDGLGTLERVRVAPGQDLAEAMRALAADPSVAFVEPNWTYSHQVTSNDPQYTSGALWGMYGDATSPANAFGSQAGEAWAAGSYDCSTVWVGIIDEGYYFGHEDLSANAGTNPGEIAGNGVDDDGNGYIDDVNGWDFDGGNNSVFDGVGDDHGTHVAGTIGGVGGNGKGVAGVCWSVKLISAKFLGSQGGTTANAILAVDYLTDLKTRHGLNLVASNNSWGGGGFSQGLQDAIERANNAGILFIAAAGNSSVDCDTTTTCYPAEYPNDNIVAVASITSTGALSSFSNYGATTVDLGAPGSAIVSTVPVRSKGKIVSAYASYSGTSMATPHVTGAAALYAARHPGSTAAQIKSALLGGVATPSLAGKTLTGDRLDVSGF